MLPIVEGQTAAGASVGHSGLSISESSSKVDMASAAPAHSSPAPQARTKGPSRRLRENNTLPGHIPGLVTQATFAAANPLCAALPARSKNPKRVRVHDKGIILLICLMILPHS